MIGLKLAALLAATAVTAEDAAAPPALATYRFEISAPVEAILTISARCDGCAWNVEGREAVTLMIFLDDRYVAHLPLVRGSLADYQVMLGHVAQGRHSVRVSVDTEETGRELRGAAAAGVEKLELTPRGDDTALALAPFLYARPNALGRFTDVPVYMWYEREPTPRGTRYRYSVIFTNEDGGTPTDRLMATWGRTTDIEYVYSVEVDAAGGIIGDDLQGPDHKILPFAGTREGRHPLLWVSTDNNMVRDTGTTRVRYAPAPWPFRLDGVSREAVMDAQPWLYALAAQELEREGKIVENAPPGSNKIPDPRRFAYIEACGEVGRAALSFELQTGDTWHPSDRGVPTYKIVRDGCFRAAIPLPAPLGSGDLRRLRIVAQSRANGGTDAAAPIRLDRINTVFTLDERYRPGPPLLKWSGPATIAVAGPPLEIPIR